MALITDNENYGYDEDLHYYYLKEKALSTLVGNEKLIDIWGNAESRLKRQAELLHTKLTESAYNGKLIRFRHKDIIEYSIFLNQHGEVDAIVRALTLIAELADDIDWDKLILTDETKWFASILQPCADAGIYFRGEINYEVPEAEYRSGY